MTLLQFKKYLDQEYLFDKVLDYILAVLILSCGLFLIYESLLTDWSNQLSLGLFISTLLLATYCVYFGIVGFLRIPNVTQIHSIINNDGRENNRKRVYDLAKKFNLFTYPYEIRDNIIMFDTKKILFGNKELFFYYNDKGIYFNVQHKNYRDPKYGYYYSTKKLTNRIISELKDSSS
jgi:hypothetical protein